ncbi:MAG: twin-arginine translocase subunit TatC [bacterium]
MTAQQNDDEQNPLKSAATGFIAHLLELRDRLLRVVLVISIAFIVLVPFAKPLYNLFSHPLVSQLPDGNKLISIGVAAPVLITYKLALMTAFLIALPYVFHQLWSFIAPGLYKHEKRLIFPILTSSVLLFYAGMAFAFYVVLPLMFGILPNFTPSNVNYTPDIAEYLNFVMMIFMAFGIGFEMPVATVLLITTGVMTRESLAQKRPYVIVGAFLVGMLMTPPDVISQILLAIPMWLLFEVGLLASHLFKRQIKQAEKEKEQQDAEEREKERQAYEESRYAAIVSANANVEADTHHSHSSNPSAQKKDAHLWEDDDYLWEETNTPNTNNKKPDDKPNDSSEPHTNQSKPTEPTEHKVEEHKTTASSQPDSATKNTPKNTKTSTDDDEYRPLTEAELDAELDRLEAEEAAEAAAEAAKQAKQPTNGTETPQNGKEKPQK